MTDDEWMQAAQRTADAFRECGEAIIAECHRLRAALIAGYKPTPSQLQAMQRLSEELKALETGSSDDAGPRLRLEQGGDQRTFEQKLNDAL